MYFTQTFRWVLDDSIIGDVVVSYELNFMLKTRFWEYSVSIYGVSTYNIFDIYYIFIHLVVIDHGLYCPGAKTWWKNRQKESRLSTVAREMVQSILYTFSWVSLGY